jgi:tetratricopeptide (TPR) repeat protein
VWKWVGFAGSLSSEHERAIQDYNKAIQLRPTFAEAFNGRGNAFDGTGDHERAIQELRSGDPLNPDYAEALP